MSLVAIEFVAAVVAFILCLACNYFANNKNIRRSRGASFK